MEIINKNKKLYFYNLLFLFGTLIILCIIELKNPMKFSFFGKIDSFDLLTLSSIIAGFLFSSFCLLIGLYDTKTVELMERSNYLNKIILSHELGFVFSSLSILISIVDIFLISTEISFFEFISIYFIIVSLFYFLLSMYYVYNIVNFIREEKKRKSQNIFDISLKKDSES
ncbi:hypothetical protein MmiEs2_05240 [Methanimicrococcus stummii]|uniref:Uncharacterized protein n=1 Tax=Methanimicrococcus stummii TaxID=3028294 RepID=A0AA96ZWY8_9EURY|nr:hypothetical protein [Methanimicrococcus sp. Es2]WNY28339.1 hypothetical protein MmiEs2_05240 [Methanimicrococcus sp. Es2]